MISRQNF